jgi:RNA polymerase sigma-70 factor (ECF subfamily)
MADGLDGQALLDRYFEPVYSYVAYRVAPDREAARDLTQDVFLAACRSVETLRSDGRAIEWLRAIARARVADHFRSLARRGLAIATEEALADLPAADTGAVSREHEVQAVQVSLVMRSLPGDYAEALENKYLDGMTVRAMAERRGQSEKAVESTLTRARGAFREQWRRIHGGGLPQGLEEEEGANP